MNMPILTQTIQVADKQTSVIQYKSLPVMTTEQMAGFYGTDPVNIRKNHMRNAERFIDGKHFFKVEGDELRTLKNSATFNEVVVTSFDSLRWLTFTKPSLRVKIGMFIFGFSMFEHKGLTVTAVEPFSFVGFESWFITFDSVLMRH